MRGLTILLAILSGLDAWPLFGPALPGGFKKGQKLFYVGYPQYTMKSIPLPFVGMGLEPPLIKGLEGEVVGPSDVSAEHLSVKFELLWNETREVHFTDLAVEMPPPPEMGPLMFKIYGALFAFTALILLSVFGMMPAADEEENAKAE